MESTSAKPHDLAGALWTFAVDLYGRPGIADACLLLQDTCRADVCLLLFALFVARERRRVLEADELEVLDAAVADWRSEVIFPLRSLRNRMKAGPHPAPSAATDALRQRVKSAEIDAEQIELAVLAQHLDRYPMPPRPATADVCEAALDRVVSFFAARAKKSDAMTSQDIRVALQAIARAMTS